MKEFAEQGIPKSGLTAKANLVLVFLDPEECILPGVSPPNVLASSWTVFVLFMTQMGFPMSGGFLAWSS